MKTKGLLKLAIVLLCCCNVLPAISDSFRQDSIKTTVANGKTVTTFYVYAPTSKNYYLKFWIMGVGHLDNSSTVYGLSIDNGATQDSIVASSGDWKMHIPKYSSAIYLTQGEHQIHIEGTLQNTPNAERVSTYSNPLANGIIQDYLLYSNMKAHVETTPMSYNDPLIANARHLSYQPTDQNLTSPSFHFNASLNKNVFYTFYRLEYYTYGQTVTVNTSADGNLSHIIHLFKASDTQYSASSQISSNGAATLNYVVPSTGFYYVLVRTLNSNEWGTCQVTINNDRHFTNVPIGCCYTSISSPIPSQKVSCFAISQNSDPMIFLMSPGNDGGIVKYNDDYPFNTSTAGYDWKKNARIDGYLSSGQWLMTLTKSYPKVSFSRCDIYARCPMVDFNVPYFPLYKTDDMICSSPDTTSVYNCLSWAVGEWLYDYRWIYNNGNAYVEEILDAYGFEPEEDEAKAKIDIWAEHDNEIYKHLSVVKKGHEYAAGYEWESKFGRMYRAFHSRYALSDGLYGQVVAHWGKESGGMPINSPVILNIHLTSNEIDAINRGKKSISPEVENVFQQLYDELISKSAFRSLMFIDEYEEFEVYGKLLELCIQYQELRFLLYDKVSALDDISTKLLKDIVLSDGNENLWNDAIEETYQLSKESRTDDAKVLFNIQTCAKLLVKKILGVERENPGERKFDYSDSETYKLTVTKRQLKLSINLETESTVSVLVGYTNGTKVDRLVNYKRLSKGEHSLLYSFPSSGIYVIGVILNGSVYKRTVAID